MRAMSPRFEAVTVLGAMAVVLQVLAPAVAGGHSNNEEIVDLGPDGMPRVISTLRFKLPVRTVTITRTVGVPIPVPVPVRHDVPVPFHVHKPVFVPVPQVVHVPYSAPRVVAEKVSPAAASPHGVFALPFFQPQHLPSLGLRDMGAFGIIVPTGLASSASPAPLQQPPHEVENASAGSAINGHQSGSAAPAPVYGYDAYRHSRSPQSTVVTVSKSIELGGAGSA